MATINTMLQKMALFLSKISPHKNDISQPYRANLIYYCYWFSEVPEAVPFADILGVL